jgi:hypothetical protein
MIDAVHGGRLLGGAMDEDAPPKGQKRAALPLVRKPLHRIVLSISMDRRTRRTSVQLRHSRTDVWHCEARRDGPGTHRNGCMSHQTEIRLATARRP